MVDATVDVTVDVLDEVADEECGVRVWRSQATAVAGCQRSDMSPSEVCDSQT